MCIVRKFCQPTHTHPPGFSCRCADFGGFGSSCGEDAPSTIGPVPGVVPTLQPASVWLRTVFRPGVPRSWSTMERPCTKAPGICFHGTMVSFQLAQSDIIWLWIKATKHPLAAKLQTITVYWLNMTQHSSSMLMTIFSMFTRVTLFVLTHAHPVKSVRSWSPAETRMHLDHLGTSGPFAPSSQRGDGWEMMRIYHNTS